MFGRSRPVVIDRYARRRSRRVLPPWLWLLLLGAAIGAGAVLYAQQAYLPPRLSAAESSRLQSSFEAAERDRSRLTAELAEARRQLAAAKTEREGAAKEVAAARRERNALHENIAVLLEALPPDPRGGAVEIRAARFDVDGDNLGYDIVLARPKPGASPFTGVLQLVVAGKTDRGTETSVPLEPVKLSVGRYEVASGVLSMPEGFVPRQATIRVLDRPDGKAFGMRVLNVK